MHCKVQRIYQYSHHWPSATARFQGNKRCVIINTKTETLNCISIQTYVDKREPSKQERFQGNIYENPLRPDTG
jgi:hypothetical protein